MTQQFTIKLEGELLESARREAERQGVTIDNFVRRLIAASVPRDPRTITGKIEDLFDLIPADASPPTDIALEKDKLIGEAVWREHLRKTGQVE